MSAILPVDDTNNDCPVHGDAYMTFGGKWMLCPSCAAAELTQLRAELDLSNKLSESDGRIIEMLRDTIKRFRAENERLTKAVEEAREVIDGLSFAINLRDTLNITEDVALENAQDWKTAHPAKEKE